MTLTQLSPTDPIVESLANDPKAALLYFIGVLLIYGFGAGLYNIVGYYNASAKDRATEYSLGRAAPVFGLAFLGAVADLIVALMTGGASASPVILALVFAGDKVESLIRSIQRSSAAGDTLQDQVLAALEVVVDERDGIEEAFRKVHDAYEQQGLPMDAQREAGWGGDVDTDADATGEEVDEGRRAAFGGKPRDPDLAPDVDVDPTPEPEPEPGTEDEHEQLHETA